MRIRERRAADGPAIERLVEACFGPAFPARTASRLRGSSLPVEGLAFVAEVGGVIAGSVACHPVRWRAASGLERPLLLLGPLAVDPRHRGAGVGTALMVRAAAALDGQQAAAVLIGDEPFYGRFGFLKGPGAEWRLPGPFEPARLLLRAASAEDWRGPAELLPAQPLEQAA